MYRQHYYRKNKHLRSTQRWKARLAIWASAFIVGIIAAIFALAAERSDELYHQLYNESSIMVYILPPVGLTFIAWLTRRFFPGSEGSGIPQAIAALSMSSHTMRSKALSLKVGIAKIFLTCLGLLSGASVGRAGPTIHVATSIMYSLRQYMPSLRSREMSQVLILAGGAAAIAAGFNAPLAGIIFAIEEMSRSFKEQKISTLLAAVVIASAAAHLLLGEYTYFTYTAESFALSSVWLAVIACGVTGGLLGGLFSSSLIFLTRQIASYLSTYPIRIAFFCGLILSLLGFLSGGQTFGAGYIEAKSLIAGGEVSLLFPLYKILATIASYLSGIPGGIFVPSLSIGAGIGADLAQYMPNIPLSTMILLGMVGYFTGVVQTPITAFVIIMEMTGTLSMLLPLMATALIAKSISNLVCPTPIYFALADAYLQKTNTSNNEK